LFAQLNVALETAIERRPFELHYPDGFRLQAPRLPAPWHLAAALIAARGLALSDRAAMIALLRALKKSNWDIGSDRSTTEWLFERKQTPQVVRRVWRPLALAALNTPLDRASAQIFANVLRDSLGATGAASEIWLPRADLSALLPDAVESYVVAHGGEVRRDARVDRIERRDRFHLHLRNEPERTIDVDAVVYAAAPTHLEHIVGHRHILNAIYEALARFEHEPIYTVYLKYTAGVRVARGFTALLDDPAKRRYAQWVFDRGAFDHANQGVLAAVISSSGPHEAESLEDVCQAVAQQLTDDLSLPAPLDTRAIADRRATLAAVPHLHRPPNRTPWPGFALAGDWTDSDYPSTLETAVRSGRAAARAVIAMN
jgi:squalene-associated FAD-dependent desaturase